MSTKSKYRGVEVGTSWRVCNSKKYFQFGTEVWQRTGVTNVTQ